MIPGYYDREEVDLDELYRNTFPVPEFDRAYEKIKQMAEDELTNNRGALIPNSELGILADYVVGAEPILKKK